MADLIPFDIWVAFVNAWWILLPAYIANLFPPLARGVWPIDRGKNFIDGRRILGDGKTFEGFGLGVFVGTLFGALEAYLYPQLNAIAQSYGAELSYMNLTIGFMIALGALVGDLAGSFIKRRRGMKRGADAPLLDQLNFVVGAVVFSYFLTKITLTMMIIMFIMTPILHRLFNILGHKLKLKREPW